MKILCVVCLFIAIVARSRPDNDYLASKAKADQQDRLRCGYNLVKLWTAEIAHTAFVAAPLITDVDANGKLDIIAAPLSETLTVVEADTGKILTNSKWPSQKLDTSILASPLQYDINGDGMLDIMFMTFSGEIIFYTANGTIIQDKFFELPHAYVKQNWYNEVISAAGMDVMKYVLKSSEQGDKDGHVPVDAHVLATPVIVDLNNDDRLEELVIPVSYFFDEDDYRLPENFDHINKIDVGELEKYLISGITVVNLTCMQVIHTIYLDLTTKDSSFLAYILFSPTVIDMDRNGGPLEIVVGTSAGNVHIIEIDGTVVRDRNGFPYSMGSIHGQVTVADVNKDKTLELVAIDTSGNVVCLNDDGTLAWEAKVSGSSSPGSRLVDIDQDGYVDVIITTNEGDVYAIHGVTGKMLENWPIRTGSAIKSNILATRVSLSRRTLDLVFLSNDGALHVVSTDQSCRTHFPIGETSWVQILSHELVSESQGVELLIATNDGTLICMGSGEEIHTDIENDELYKNIMQLSLPAEVKSPNDFLFSSEKLAVFVLKSSRKRAEVIGSHFYIEFYILDPTYTKPEYKSSLYTLKVYFGKTLLHKSTYTQPDAYSILVHSFPTPSYGHILLILTNKNGQIAQDMFPIRFNQIILQDLQWLLMAPFVALIVILLLNHGFPAKDLLPITVHSKDR